MSGVPNDKALQVTTFEVEGMENTDISWRFHTWFVITMVLAVLLAALKGFSIVTVEQNIHPCYSCAQISQGLFVLFGLSWFFTGVYWRFEKWGALCSESTLSRPGYVI